MAPSSSELTIVILSFNTKDQTIHAVKSCLSLDIKPQVVVVDNHSVDGTVDALKEQFKNNKYLRVIARSVNDGFAAGNNVALREVYTPYVMLLNSDASFVEGSVMTTLLEYMEANSKVGMLTPKVVLANGHLDPAAHRGFPTPLNAIAYYLGLEKHHSWFGGYHQTWKNTDEIHEIDACSGAAMLMRTKAMREVGLMDEQFFMYGEDLDWCFRFKEKGWQIIYHPAVTVLHEKHSSGLKKTKRVEKSPETIAIQHRATSAFYDAMQLFYDKHYTKVYPAWLRGIVLLGVKLQKQKHIRSLK